MNIIQARCGGTLQYLCIPAFGKQKEGIDLGQRVLLTSPKRIK